MLCHKPNFLNICRFAVPDLSTIHQLYLWVAKEQKPFFKRLVLFSICEDFPALDVYL